MAFSAVPTGTILPFGGATAPSGWLLCDGASVAIASYSALNSAIGVLWGNPGGGSFNLPNLTGSFVRGIGTSGAHVGPATVGAVQAHATAKNGLGVTNNPVTSDPENRSHTHDPQQNTLFYTGEAIPGISGGASGLRQFYELSGRQSSTASQNHTHSVSSNVTLGAGDTETRPNSKGVNYIIKI